MGFVLVVSLAVLGLFVLDGGVAGVASLAALLALIGACIYALRGEDPDAVKRSDRTGLTGWIGGWF
jgi:hypothetical protein